jgi:O-antigen/teichoic acid export membrane protein
MLKRKFHNLTFFKQTVVTIIGFSLRFGIKAIFFLFVARELGPSDYGGFASITALTSVFTPFVSWGSGNILVKHVSRSRDEYGTYFGSALLVTMISGIFFVIVLLLLDVFFIRTTIALFTVFCISMADLFFGRWSIYA